MMAPVDRPTAPESSPESAPAPADSHEAGGGAEPRWRRLPEERPQQIVDAALEVFGERGLAGARLEDIARRAGISKGTIYLYFPNKETLFEEVVRRTIVARLEEAELSLSRETGNAHERAMAFMRQWWSFLRTPAFTTVYRLVIGELHRFPDLARFYSEEVAVRAFRLISGIIRQGVESGEFRPVDPAVVTRILSGIFLTHALWCSKQQQFAILAPQSDAEVLEQLSSFFFHAIRPNPGSETPAAEHA